MKFLQSIMVTIAFTSCVTNYGMFLSPITMDVTITPNQTDHIPAYISYGKESYTTGGTVFTYSAPFTIPPVVAVTVETLVPTTGTTYMYEVSANSTTSVTVMVFQSNSGTVNEADPGSVTVHVIAIGD